jgi:PKD repeat protein
VKATNATDTSINSVVSVTLQKPEARFGISTKYLFVQPNASSAAPIVVGDRFFDASDGSVESHYNTWTIDGTTTTTSPATLVDVGACGSHNVIYTAHYGPYSPAPIASLGPDAAIGINGVGYGVRPFAAGIEVSSIGDQVAFSSLSRVSADQNALTSAQAAALTYKWELLNAQNAIIQAGPAGTWPIPQWLVPKSVFTTPGIRGRLTITSPNGVGASCAGLTASTALTTALNGPDPTITGGCTSGGPPCNYSVASPSGVDQVADGWIYNWSAAGATPSSATTKNYSPLFTSVGTYTINLTVTNSVGTKLVSKSETVTVAGSTCPTMNDGNVFINTTSGCTSQYGDGCAVGTPVAFRVGTFGYDFTCGSHSWTWQWGDGTANSTGQSVSHTFGSVGTFPVKVTIQNASQTFTISRNVTTGGSVQPPPPPPPGPTPPPPPPPPGGCATMTPGVTVFIAYNSASNSCTQYGGSCPAGQPVSFSAKSFGYDFACASHTFGWNFGDSQGGSGKETSHTFAVGGTYNVTLSISNGSQQVSTTASVIVGAGGPPPPPPPPGPTPPRHPPVVARLLFRARTFSFTTKVGERAAARSAAPAIPPRR